MKITDTIRARFVASVMAASPETDYDSMAERLVCTTLYNHYTPEVRACIDDPEKRKWMRTCLFLTPLHLSAIKYYGGEEGSGLSGKIKRDLPDLWTQLCDLSKQKGEDTRAKSDATELLERVILQHTTVEDFVAKHPWSQPFMEKVTATVDAEETYGVSDDEIRDALSAIGLQLP